MPSKLITRLQLATAIGTTIFWVLFFTVGFENPAYPSYYLKFEHSFPLPDSFIIVMLVAAFINQKKESWKKYTLVAGGAMIFLGLCDFSFNSMNGMYTVGLSDSVLNALINLWSVCFGFYQIKYAWKL